MVIEESDSKKTPLPQLIKKPRTLKAKIDASSLQIFSVIPSGDTSVAVATTEAPIADVPISVVKSTTEPTSVSKPVEVVVKKPVVESSSKPTKSVVF